MLRGFFTILVFLISASSFGIAADKSIGVGIDEQLGSYIPLDAQFKDENGNAVVLKDLIDQPTVLAFVYYQCPGICSPLLFSLTEVINKSDLELGYDYKVICISFNDQETPQIASDKKKSFVSGLEKNTNPEDWKFLTGDSLNIKSVTDAAGFRFERKDDLFLHAGAFLFLDKKGKICRYLLPSYTESHGFGILPFDFKMAVLEASAGKETPTIAKMLRFCFSYDTQGQKYTMNITRIFGAAILLFAVGFFIFVIKKPKKAIIN
jgi:protein SCO1